LWLTCTVILSVATREEASPLSSRHSPAPAEADVAGIQRQASSGAGGWLDAGNKSRHDKESGRS